jgi:hypothetical protein
MLPCGCLQLTQPNQRNQILRFCAKRNSTASLPCGDLFCNNDNDSDSDDDGDDDDDDANNNNNKSLQFCIITAFLTTRDSFLPPIGSRVQ